MPTRTSLAVETKGLLFLWLAHLNNKSNVGKQISSLYIYVQKNGHPVGSPKSSLFFIKGKFGSELVGGESSLLRDDSKPD